MNLPELTNEEREAIDSIDMTLVLGTWKERCTVAMEAAKRLLRENRKLREEISNLRSEISIDNGFPFGH